MKTCFSCLRKIAYHMVVASFVPWILCQGRGGRAIPSEISASTSCL